MILAILGVIVVVILGLIGWCIFRFFKKKKPKGAEEKGKEDDENALVDNEEANAEEVSPFKIIFSIKIGQKLSKRAERAKKGQKLPKGLVDNKEANSGEFHKLLF